MNYQDMATKFWELHKADEFPSHAQMIAIRLFADWLEEEVDSESDGFVLEALPRTVVYTLQGDDIDPNNIGSFPWGTDISDWIDGFDDLIEETDYLEEDDE